MAEIVKHGNKFKNSKVITCPFCDCEFIPTEIYSCDSSGYNVYCPECQEKIYKSIIDASYKSIIDASSDTSQTFHDKQRMNKCIECIMEQIEFDKIHNVMKTLDWRWARIGIGVPTIDDIKTEARDILINAWSKKATVQSGGFRASYHYYEETAEVGLSLDFEVTWGDIVIDKDDKLIYY